MKIHIVRREDSLPSWADREQLALFLHETMRPYQDTVEDIQRALSYAFSSNNGKGGFLVLGELDGKLVGAVVMLNTGMKGYIPETVLVFVSVSPQMRGSGLGGRLIRKAIDEADGNVKLHVEHENPARRLYERIGFTSKYLEMRYEK
jgi:ribosomal protein S18 acetylase RimI-like enzyme